MNGNLDQPLVKGGEGTQLFHGFERNIERHTREGLANVEG